MSPLSSLNTGVALRLHNELSNQTRYPAAADSSSDKSSRTGITRVEHRSVPTPPHFGTARVAAQTGVDGRERRRWAVRLWFAMAVMAAFWWMLAGVVSAQQFDAIKLPPAFEAFKDPKRASQLERAVMQLKTAKDLSKVDSSAPGMSKFYLEQYIPWKITQRESLPELSDIVEGLLKDVDGAQRIGSAGTRTLLAGTFVGMKKVAEGNYLPAARINAINALARLNEKPLDIANGRPPLPLRYSYPILFKLYTDENESDGIRAAALHGIHHYTRLAFPVMKPDEKTALVTEMNNLLNQEVPGSRDPKAHAYLQRFAVDILNILRAPNDATLGTQLISISTSEEKPDLIALYSASKLGGFQSGLEGKVENPGEVMKQWSARAFNAVQSELDRFAAQTRPRPAQSQPPNPIDFLRKAAPEKPKAITATRKGRAPSGMMGDPGMGMGMGPDMDMEMGMEMGMGMGMGPDMDMGMGMDMGYGMMQTIANPQPPEVNLSRRKIDFVLQQLLQGATGSAQGTPEEKPSGLMAGVPENQRAEVQAWVDRILEVSAVVNDEQLDTLEEWLEALDTQRPVLGDLAGIEVDYEEEDTSIQENPVLPMFPGFGNVGGGDADQPADGGLPGAGGLPAAGGLPGQ
ncbi:hypothetical protein [Rhodopirellula sallentina]|uniref:hypothetical protein n=1 Tax=Rhodopirellula sallentina TaxID=1263869 RepID=UPI001F247827|nr:hypothetical protein [Rhodopirellula sallentina]